MDIAEATAADLQAALDALNTQQGEEQQKEPLAPTAPPETPVAPAVPELGKLSQPKPAEPVNLEGVLAEVTNAYLEGQTPSDETYSQLAELGLSKSFVNNHLTTQENSAKAFESTAIEAAGGEAALNEILDWASSNISKRQQQLFDAAVNERDMAAFKESLAFITSKFNETKTPQSVRRLNGANGTGVASNVPFSTRDEYYAAILSPEYNSDPDVRAYVSARRKASQQQNIF